MASFKKYINPEMEIVLMENDIITTSTDISGGGSGGIDPLEKNSVSRMNSFDRPLGIFKRN